MDAQDRQALLDIAARAETVTDDEPYAPTSPTRMSRIALTVVKHADEFDLDGTDPEHTLPMETYIASLLADILHFADVVRPGESRNIMEHAIHFVSDSETPTYEGLKGFKVG